MSYFVKDWGGFEEFIKSLHNWKNVCVERNVKLKGKSGVEHQIDILLTYSNGLYKDKVLIECKYWKTNIKKESILAMISKMEDLNATQGAFFTTKGYQSGAKEVARHRGIRIFTVRELNNDEWGSPGRVLDFYCQVISRRIDNLDLELKVLAMPSAPTPLLIPEFTLHGPEKTKTLLKREQEEPDEILEELVDQVSNSYTRKLITEKVFNEGADGPVYFIIRGVRIHFSNPRIIVLQSYKLALREIIFDLGIKVDQKHFLYDRMDQFQYAVLVEDIVTNIKYVAQKSIHQEFSIVEELNPSPSVEGVLASGTILQLYTNLTFEYDNNKLLNVMEVKRLQRTNNSLLNTDEV